MRNSTPCRCLANRRGRQAAGLLCLWLGVAVRLAGESPAGPAAGPPSEVVTLDTNAAGASPLSGPAGTSTRQSSSYAGVTAFIRQPFAGSAFYWSLGIQAETYDFHGAGALSVGPLKDAGVHASIEYFVGSEEVAALNLRPGLYFEGHSSSSAWDVPFDLASGFPIRAGVDGVVGISAGRFYRNQVPIVGVVWTLGPQVRLEAVCPEPALVWTPRKDTELRIAGELDGGGFRASPSTGGSSVEYLSYRVGSKLGCPVGGGLRVTVGAGREVLRRFEVRYGPTEKGSGSWYGALGLELAR